ncbi:MAG: DUF6444 domain-containing protein [Isosphaeraceae bacterium]
MCDPVAPWSLKALQLLAILVTLLSMSEAPATPVAPCPECLRLRAAVDQARKQIAELQAELHELRCRLNRNSSNSSSPPSVDPPGPPGAPSLVGSVGSAHVRRRCKARRRAERARRG